MSKSQVDTPYIQCDLHHIGADPSYPHDTHHTTNLRLSYPHDVSHNPICLVCPFCTPLNVRPPCYNSSIKKVKESP